MPTLPESGPLRWSLAVVAAVSIPWAPALARAEGPARAYEGPSTVVGAESEPEATAPTLEPSREAPAPGGGHDGSVTAAPTRAPIDPRDQPFLPPRRGGLSLDPAALDVGKAKFTPGKGIGLVSADKRFALSISMRTGFLYSVLHSDGGSSTNALELRRLRLVLSGNVFGEHAKYFVQLALAPRELQLRDGTLHSHPAYDVYMQFDRLRDLTLRIGMYRPQYSRERLIQDINPLLIDRSVANAEFNLDRDIGFDLRSEDFLGLGRLRYYAGVFSGEGRNAEGQGDFGFLYTGRVDVLPLGMFDDYDASDQTRLRRFRFSLGAAYAFIDEAKNDRGVLGSPPADGGTTDMHDATADVLVKWRGLYVEGGYLYRHGRRKGGRALDDMMNPIPTVGPRNGQGWYAQAGFLIPRTYVEPALRMSQVFRQGASSTLANANELGGGLNYYFAGHNLKLQVDYFHLWGDAGLRSGSEQLRLQLQVAL